MLSRTPQKSLQTYFVGTILFSILLLQPLHAVEGNQIEMRCNEFAFDLFRHLPDKTGNIFFSPFSVFSSLSMTWAGANGQTGQEMATVLHFASEDKKNIFDFFASQKASIAAINTKKSSKLLNTNSLWMQKSYSFLPAYLSEMETNFSAKLFSVDFQETEKTRIKINSWVEDQTQKKIKELIKKGLLDLRSRLVLVNAIYFKGSWHTPFDKKNTVSLPFHKTERDSVLLPFLHRESWFSCLNDSSIQIVELPYDSGDISMFIMLPGSKNTLAGMEKQLTNTLLDSLLSSMNSQKVNLHIPRFSISHGILLGKTLSAMGMPTAFAADADFSGMTGKKDFAISEVIHQAVVDVNEEGTEAAAATAVVMRYTAISETVEFRADRPFIFFIRHNSSRLILFMGRYAGA